MAYDEGLAQQIREYYDNPQIEEKKMFGGLCYLINGNMICGVVGEKLMVRIGKERYNDALDQEHVLPMDFTGRPMRGMIYLDEKGSTKENVIAKWLDVSLEFAFSLPPK